MAVTATKFDHPPRLMAYLKKATSSIHGRLHDAPFFVALAAGELPLESYVGHLRSLLAMHGVIESVLVDCQDQSVTAVWDKGRVKCHWLQQDLQFFQPRIVADLKEAVEVTQRVADYLRLESIRKPIALLGWLYVLEGSTQGALIIRPQITRAFGLVDAEGTRYLQAYGQQTQARWEAFSRRMDALLLTAQTREDILQAANELFGFFDALFSALYPFRPESKVIGVSAINPEAGQHPIPVDIGEVEAAIQAGDLCWQRFAYFEARYGERGLRFARSDAAWLATLHRYSPTRILEQVRWLGRVLAGRGMPTLLLEVQLEMLVDALVAVCPDKRSDYQKLLSAAADLRERRAIWLTEPDVTRLSGAFDDAVDTASRLRHPDTGKLLCAAVADEMTGSLKAVESLRVWMTDSSRFSADWITAVESTLAQARQQASLKSSANLTAAKPLS